MAYPWGMEELAGPPGEARNVASDIIVIGASAGGLEPLRVLVAGLPRDLAAAVFVVVHIGNGINGRSELPAILSRSSPLPAKHPADGEEIQHGVIYVAPPDRHLLVFSGHAHLSNAPKENRTRPAVNPLFRSAAHTYRERVAGVILSGSLDDGVAGLAEIKRCGGIAIAQEPATALYPSMPLNAIERVRVDHTLPVESIPGVIVQLCTVEHTAMYGEEPMERTLVSLTCPECRGPLWEERQGRIVEYRCRVGHVYSPLAMAAEHDDTVERTMWSTLVALEEAADIADHLVPHLGAQSAAVAQKNRQNASIIKKMLEERGS